MGRLNATVHIYYLFKHVIEDEADGMSNQSFAMLFSVDPLSKKYTMMSSYQLARNHPIEQIELEGLEGTISKGMGSGTIDTVKSGL